MKEEMKIAFGGPSGSGKTTLANYIHEDKGIRQVQSFETRNFDEETKVRWQQEVGYAGDIGHTALISLQNANPEFGVDWQTKCLICRDNVIRGLDSFVMDRSPVDNVAYMLTQVSPYMSEEQIMNFITIAQKSFQELTHFIRIQVTEQDSVENNGSRVSNLYYQKLMSDVFDSVYDRYFAHLWVPTLVLNEWDLNQRKEDVYQFITPV